MAVLALGFVGSALGGAIGGSILGVSAATIGGFIGSTIGGMVDNMLFPQKVEGPRLGDLSVTVSTYGAPIPLLFGPENRIAGNVIWSTGLIETKKKVKQGGKGGPSVETTEYSYRASVAVLVGEGALFGLRKIWANNKVIFDADEQLGDATGDPEPGIIGKTLRALVEKDGQGAYSAIRFYPGDFEQEPDPTIESYVGVGETPAYRGSCYVVIADLQLADFGNRLPNFEFLIAAQDQVTTREVATEIIRRCGLDPNTASTSSVQGDVRGYAIGRASSGVGALQPLALAYDFDVGEEAGGLRLTNRGSPPLGVVLTDHLAGHAFGEDRPEAIRFSRATETDLPREAVVTFPDPERDYQVNSQRAVRAAGSADSNLSNEIPIVLTADEGRRLVDRTLWEAWTGRQTAEARTDDRWVGMVVGRTYLFETPAGLEPLRITRKTRGVNGVVELAMRRDRAAVYDGSRRGAGAAVPPNTVRVPGPTELILLDIPLLVDADDVTPAGFYWGVVGSGDGWRGADVRRALEPTGPYDEVAPQGYELTVGDVVDVLPDAPRINSDPWDMTSTITVTLRRPDMTLSSVTEAEVLDGANAAYIGPQDGHGGEIIGFLDATPTGVPGQYELSGLLRGRRGTEFAADEHGTGEMFVPLEIGALQRVSYGVPDVGQERAYKAVSLLLLEADAEAVLWTNTGVGMRPYSPVDLHASWSSGGDIELTWTRRSRIGEGINPPPLAEETEAYVVQILDGPVVVREFSPVSPHQAYTVAEQTADFGAPVESLTWRVAQVSAAYGPGIYARRLSYAYPFALAVDAGVALAVDDGTALGIL